MKIISTDSTNIDNKWHENEELSLHGRKITDYHVEYLSKIESRVDPQIAFLNLKNLKPQSGLNRVFTNIDNDLLHPFINSYYDYLKYSFFNNRRVAIKSEWIYFEMLRKIGSIISDRKNIDKFKEIFNGRENKIHLLHIFDIRQGFSMSKMSNDLFCEISKNVKFNTNILKNLSNSEDSDTAFNLITMFSGKNYYEYFALGNQGCQGAHIPAFTNKEYLGFESVIFLDGEVNYETLYNNIDYLKENFGKLDVGLGSYLEKCKLFVKKIQISINKNSEFLENILKESKEILDIDNNILLTLNYAECYSNCNPLEIDYAPHDISVGLCLVRPHNDIPNLQIIDYGWVMWRRYFEENNLKKLEKLR